MGGMAKRSAAMLCCNVGFYPRCIHMFRRALLAACPPALWRVMHRIEIKPEHINDRYLDAKMLNDHVMDL